MKRLSRRDDYISEAKMPGGFALAADGKPVPVFVAKNDFQGVKKTAEQFCGDLEKVTGNRPALTESDSPQAAQAVIAGTLGFSALIDSFAERKLIDSTLIEGKWDCFLIQVVDKPFDGMDRALVIAGGNKRGTIYGMYDISERIGVSPWHWFADVPVKKHASLYVQDAPVWSGEPSVRYRGFFINDEYPCLGEHVHEKYGGFTHKFYVRVFELLLRMKANYFWPAMWNDCFHDDDPLNTEIADEMGVIMGTSHHEPLMRAWKEWKKYGKGDWNPETNREYITEYWRGSVKRQGSRECIMTVGMRGDGDEPLTEESREDLLLDIIDTQRSVIKEVLGRDPAEVPQMWAVYKEVQEYYDKGVHIPDDILIMLCDDNWGNIRQLPREEDKKRSGGIGLYYHFDYVGGPRNYKWINTSPLPRVWEQLHLAWQGGIDRLWIVNIGDIKPLEFPTSFFLAYAWNIDDWNSDQLDEYTRRWAEDQFGPEYAAGIAAIISEYAKFNSRRKPELLSPQTFSLINFQEAEKAVADYNDLLEKAHQIKRQLPQEYMDAYFELVEYPVSGYANLLELHVTTARNRLYAAQRRAGTNVLGDKVRELFARDMRLRDYYNKDLAGGKWSHMAAQNHISYTIWQQPDEDVVPDLETYVPAENAEMAVAVEASAEAWPGSSEQAVVPEFTVFGEQRHYIEIFNRGKVGFDFAISKNADWLLIEDETGAAALNGKVEDEKRIWLRIDPAAVTAGKHTAELVISGAGSEVKVSVPVRGIAVKSLAAETAFFEADSHIAIEAEHFSFKQENDGLSWKILPGMGRTLSGVTCFPVDRTVEKPGGASPSLGYNCFFLTEGEIRISVYLCPTNKFIPGDGLHYGISVDDGPVRKVNMHSDMTPKDWQDAVKSNIKKITTAHMLDSAGLHRVKFWAADPGVVLQKIVIWTGKEKASYLGPPESWQGAYPEDFSLLADL